MSVHKVKQGECLASIAAKYGFGDGKIIYQHPQNAELRKMRPSPHLLYPGDEVFVPEKKLKTVTVKMGQELRIRVKVPTRKIQLDILDESDRPLANADWLIEGDGLEARGKTNGNGRVEAEVPATTSWLTLQVDKFVYHLELGELDPMEKVPDSGLSGLRGRLSNLGYEPGPEEPEMTAQTRVALSAFQRDHGLEATGEPEQQTLDKLKEVHGC